MDINKKIEHLGELSRTLLDLASDEDFLRRLELENPWFVPSFTKIAIENICYQYLDKSKLREWLSNYDIQTEKDTLGLILAGNIPLVGFHDLLCAYFCSVKVKVKISSKDSLLNKTLIDKWATIDNEWAERLEIVEKIENCDKIIATGSNNTYKYFEQYFSKYKHILRKNRTSMGIIHKSISDKELEALMNDIFLFFGLGCRNISKLWIEKGFDIKRIFEAAEKYNFLFNHQKYMNNYDYQRTLLLLNKIEHLSNNFLMIKEDSSLYSPISVLHYEYFESESDYKADIQSKLENLQCIIGREDIPFGEAQVPSLSDYADGIDTIGFLIE